MNRQFFLGFFWGRTTTADRPVAPWPNHKPESSNFGSASPNWHFNAEPQRHQFWTGGSITVGIRARWPAAGDCLRFAGSCGSARFACSAADWGWAPLAPLALLWRMLHCSENVAKKTQMFGRRCGRWCKHRQTDISCWVLGWLHVTMRHSPTETLSD